MTIYRCRKILSTVDHNNLSEHICTKFLWSASIVCPDYAANACYKIVRNHRLIKLVDKKLVRLCLWLCGLSFMILPDFCDSLVFRDFEVSSPVL